MRDRPYETRSYTAPSIEHPHGLPVNAKGLKERKREGPLHRRGTLQQGLTPWGWDWNDLGLNKEIGEKRSWDHEDVEEFSLGEPLDELNHWEPEWKAQWETKSSEQRKKRKRNELYGGSTTMGRKRAFKKRALYGRDKKGRFVWAKPDDAEDPEATEMIGENMDISDGTATTSKIRVASLSKEPLLDKLHKLAQFYGYDPQNGNPMGPAVVTTPRRRILLKFRVAAELNNTNIREQLDSTNPQRRIIRPSSSREYEKAQTKEQVNIITPTRPIIRFKDSKPNTEERSNDMIRPRVLIRVHTKSENGQANIAEQVNTMAPPRPIIRFKSSKRSVEEPSNP